MEYVKLGDSDLNVSKVCLGTMTFGEQVDEATAHAIMDRALERGINFLDTAEMYSVPPRAETFGATERILGSWFTSRPGVRERVVLASKVAGPARGYDWIRNASPDLTGADIIAACDASLLRAAYHLGNRHVALQLHADHLKLERDHVLADLLRQMHLTVTEVEEPFEPEFGAYGGPAHHRHDGHVHPTDDHPHHGQP